MQVLKAFRNHGSMHVSSLCKMTLQLQFQSRSTTGSAIKRCNCSPMARLQSNVACIRYIKFPKTWPSIPQRASVNRHCQQQLACSGFCSICTTKTPAVGCSGCVAQKRGATSAGHYWCNETERLHHQCAGDVKLLTHLKNSMFLSCRRQHQLAMLLGSH